ncbi:hypothetical protein PVL29_002047 [Vitis rotundifolia]|uniref:Uncharacterized protein n=1 Tax=Vitis rotundifolia TaxID=103349 RepID=A0AA39AFY4_VITRO|nr:hypothetical protein PVL29_002047 [Vitis rotundifolia]
MVWQGCSIHGSVNDSNFNEPMPWIGIYVAAASLVCSLAMGADAFLAFRHTKFWFPCNFFSLHATSLTIIAVATKLSVNLNTSMPRCQDQLSKLSSTVLMCTVMGNFMPSIGTMENKEVFSNVISLGILVITLMVNVCIQIGTGVIYVFWKEHAVLMFIMLVLLLILSFSAMTVPTTKHYFEFKYCRMYEIAVRESSNEAGIPVFKKLREDLMKYWTMAHTCCPQFVKGRSVTCSAYGALCLFSAAILVEAWLRTTLMPWSFKFCSGESDYKWSVTFILINQTIAVGLGTIGPAFRCFKDEFKVEKYWIQRLVEWRECPIGLPIHSRQCRKLVHDLLADLCIIMQIGIVLVCRAVRLVSIFFIRCLLIFSCWFKELIRKLKLNNSISNNESGSESLQPNLKQDISRFVLYLEGEEDLVDLMTKSNCNPIDCWLHMVRKTQPKYLMQLLEKHMSSQGFKGVETFDSDKVPSLDYKEVPNCWALPVVTLTTIAVALPHIEKCSIKRLMRSVHEGLSYNCRKAADTVWLGVDLYHKRLGVDIRKMALQAKGPKEVVEELADIAKNRLMEYNQKTMAGGLKETPSKLPIKVLAANSMYRIAQTILLDDKWIYEQMSVKLFEELSVVISDILVACLTNTPHAISMECISSIIEEREDRILELLDQKALPSLDTNKMICVDDWHLLSKQNQLHFAPSSDCKTEALNSDDLCLSID